MGILTDEEVAADREGDEHRARLDHAADMYIGSNDELDDACHWIQSAILDPAQAEDVCDWYRWSADHATAIADIASGERSVSS